MTSRTFLIAALFAAASLFAAAPAAHALNLSAGVSDPAVSPGEVFQVTVDVDEAGPVVDLMNAGVAGAALTLQYPDAAFNVHEDTGGEDYFVAGSGMFHHVVTDTRLEPGDPPSAVPSIGNMASGGKVMVSGAFVDSGNGGGAYTGAQNLFFINLTPKTDAVPGWYALAWVNSEICNFAAGWGTDNNANGECDPGEEEVVPALVGAVSDDDDRWGGENLSDDFPVLLNELDGPVTTEVKINEYGEYEDDIDDDWERTWWGDSLNVANNETDHDQDGYSDDDEENNGTSPDFQDNEGNEYPDAQDPAFELPGYDPATDNRGPYQVVMTDPESPTANPGESFTMVVNYDPTDENQNLSGLGLRIHYDSSKLTWAGFSNVLATAKIAEDTEPSDDPSEDGGLDNDTDTDKYLTVEWDCAASTWPGVDLPAALYTVSFTATEDLEEGETTTINFTASFTDPDYAFYGYPVEVRTCTPGDVNGDGRITPADASAAFQLYLTKEWEELTPGEKCAADFNGDQRVTPADASLIFQEYLNQ